MTFEEHVAFIKNNKCKPIELTKHNIAEFIADIGKIFDEQAVPKKDRFISFLENGEIKKKRL